MLQPDPIRGYSELNYVKICSYVNMHRITELHIMKIEPISNDCLLFNWTCLAMLVECSWYALATL